MPRPNPENVRTIGIVGAGTIGASWTAYFLSRGYHCTVYDPSPTAEMFLRTYVETAWAALTELGLPDNANPTRFSVVDSIADAVKDADFIQESVPERMAIKHETYAAIGAAARPDTVVASSASGLSISEIQKGDSHPERVVLAHPFNPPHIIPLVEIMGGKQTDPAATNWAQAFFDHIGKQTIRVKKEVPAHVANRLQAALWREAIHMVAEGVCSVEDVDKACAYGPGLRWSIMGPHMLFHLGAPGGEAEDGPTGIERFCDRFAPSFHTWWDSMGTPTLTPEVIAMLKAGIAEEEAGRTPEALAAERDRKLVAAIKAIQSV